MISYKKTAKRGNSPHARIDSLTLWCNMGYFARKMGCKSRNSGGNYYYNLLDTEMIDPMIATTMLSSYIASIPRKLVYLRDLTFLHMFAHNIT